jgi:hypothetical protein
MCVMCMYRLEYMYQCRRTVSFEEGFLFVSLRSKNNWIEAKRKIGGENKRKEAKKFNRIFQVNKRNTRDTDPISLYFACILSKLAHTNCVLIRPEILLFPPTFQMSTSSVVSLSTTVEIHIKPLYGRGRGEHRLEIAQTISLNCGVTHSPGKIEYNCRYFLMTFRKQKRKKKFCKKKLYRVLCFNAHWPIPQV